MSVLTYIQLVAVSTNLLLVGSLQPFLDTDIDYAASPVDLQRLAHLEITFVYNLLSLNYDFKKGDVLDSYLQDFHSTMLSDVGLELNQFRNLVSRGIVDSLGFGYDAAKHPLKIYKIIKRYVRILNKVEETEFRNNSVSGIIKAHLSKRNSFPKETDLTTAALSILKLNQLYRLPFSDFLIGKIGPFNTKCGLSLEDLFHLGEVALDSVLPSQAIDLFDTIMTHQDYESLSNQNEIDKLLLQAIEMHDSKITVGLDLEDIQYDSGPQLFNKPLYNKSTSNFRNRTLVDAAGLLDGVSMEIPSAQLIPLAYKFAELCTTEKSTENPAEDSKLKCLLTSKSHPFYILNPLKVEIHNWSPLLVQYYDVVNDRDITQLKDEVRGELRMSRIMRTPEEINGTVSRHRTSSNAWIKDWSHPKFHHLLIKIGNLLNVTTSKFTSTEHTQIAAYSPGGHYVPHTDAVFEEGILEKLDPSEFLRGDRIVTFMIYLSDVEAGGATAFPVIEKVIKPKKGSAVVWFNLFSDGTIRRDTFHGGCSVMYGVKWIANKWIRSLDQMFNLQCSKVEGSSLSLDL